MKTYPANLIIHAQNLRSSGSTYAEICDKLGTKIPKSTLNGWVRHITPPDSYQMKLAQISRSHLDKVRLYAVAKNKMILNARLDKLRSKNKHLISKIDKSTGIIILSMLYWAEGTKYPSHRNLQFGNSDPGMIKLYITLLRLCFDIDEPKFRLAVQCRSDQNQDDLSDYWAEITAIPRVQHYKPRVDSRSIGKPTKKKSYKGVCVIDYFDSSLQCELQYFGQLLGSDKAIKQMKKQLK